MKLKLLFFVCSLAFTCLLPLAPLLAQPAEQGPSDICSPNSNLRDCVKQGLGSVSGGKLGTAGPVSSTFVAARIGSIISYALAFVGVIFLILAVVSGIQWMGAGGNEEIVKKSRTRLVNASVGLIITLAAYAITFFVVSNIQNSINNTPEVTTPPSP